MGQSSLTMNIGMPGPDDVAKTLGAGFLKHGHEVILGSVAQTRQPVRF